MAQTAHTDGPYRLSSAVMDGFRPIMAPGGAIVALVSALSPNSEETGMVLAAAPDMLRACKALDAFWLADWEPPHPDPAKQEPRILSKETLDVWRDLRAAIAKAEGR